VEVTRPWGRTADDEHELPVATCEHFAGRDPLTRAVMDRMLAGVSTRRFAVVGEKIERASRSTGKSAVSEIFIEWTRTALSELMSRQLEDVRLAAMMLDGLEIAGRAVTQPTFVPDAAFCRAEVARRRARPPQRLLSSPTTRPSTLTSLLRIGSIASFSGCRRMWSGSRKKRFTVASSPSRATTISPSRAVS
jgi:hypothetical protein